MREVEEVDRVTMKEDLYKDIENRAQAIYQQYQCLMREVLKDDTNLTKSQLKFYLIEDGRIGGKSWYKSNIDNIEINTGVIDNFFDYFYDFAEERSKKFLKMMSFSADEIEGKEISYEGIVFEDSGKAKAIDSKAIDVSLAILLNIFVARFILTHELGHLLNGHCEYLNAKRSNSVQYIPMFYSETDKVISIPPLDSRTLEMDADAFAATDNFRNLVLLYNKFEERVDRSLNIQPIDLFFWWSFAIRSTFLQMQNKPKDGEFKSDMTHLPSAARWCLIIGSIETNIKSGMYKIDYRNEDNEEKIMEAIIKGSAYAEKYFNEKSFLACNWITELIENKDYKKFVSEIENNWETLSSKLNCFSRLSLYGS